MDENCSDLYNAQVATDPDTLRSNLATENEPETLRPAGVMRGCHTGHPQPEEWEVSRVDNLPTELIKCGGEETAGVLTDLRHKIWETMLWAKEWTQCLLTPLPEKKKKKNQRQ